MKRRIFICMVATIAIAACTPKEKTVDFPAVGATNTDYIIIEKVEMTDSLTSLHIRGYHFPGWWIKIVKDTYLDASWQPSVVHRCRFPSQIDIQQVE